MRAQLRGTLPFVPDPEAPGHQTIDLVTAYRRCWALHFLSDLERNHALPVN